jgi:hypothetical protein
MGEGGWIEENPSSDMDQKPAAHETKIFISKITVHLQTITLMNVF